VPDSTVVSMIVQSSDKQLKYLATNELSSKLRVLVFDDDSYDASNTISTELPKEYTNRALDYALLNVTRNGRNLVWLRLDTSGYNPANVEASIQLLTSLKVLECSGPTWIDLNVSELKQLQYLILYACNKLTKLTVEGLVELQFLMLKNCNSLTTVQGLAELTTLRSLDLSHTDITVGALVGLSKLTKLQELSMNMWRGVGELAQLGSLNKG
jgi:Leucine-rich repeat (LRR) protein